MTQLGLFSQLEPKPDKDAALFVGFDVDDDIAYLAIYKKAPPEGSTKKPNVMVALDKKQRRAISKILEVHEEEEK